MTLKGVQSLVNLIGTALEQEDPNFFQMHLSPNETVRVGGATVNTC